MVDHRHTLGESGRSYLCYVPKPPKIALVEYHEHGLLLPSTNFQVHGLLSRDYDHMALTVGQWSCSAAPDLSNPAEARSVEHRVPGVAGV